MMSSSTNISEEIPLCVDLDGTLIRTDLLYETLLRSVKNNPLCLFSILFWLAKGKAFLKFKLAEIGFFDCKNLPYQEEVVKFVQKEWHKNRPIYLVTAASSKVAEAVAKERPFFVEVLSSSETLNLKGEEKASHLVNRFGEKKFDYIGNSKDDIPVFKKSRAGYLATNSKSKASHYKQKYNTETISLEAKNGIAVFLKSIRLHQWAKNFLIFVPLILSHQYFHIEYWLESVLSFLCFGFCASGVYLLNDLLDLDSDRKHHTKKNRPMASGHMSIAQGLIGSILLLVVSFGLAVSFVPINFSFILAAYFIYTCLYSFWLKEQLIIDTVSLALLYTVRIVAGHAATGVPVSHWLLTFSLFLFLSLAFLKRTSELYNMKSRNIQTAFGRAYNTEDFSVIQSLGVSSGFISVLVFVLYLDSSAAKVLYKQTTFLFLIIPIFLYWVGRAWALATRGKINEDPIVWAIRDRVSHLVLALIGALFILAQ